MRIPIETQKDVEDVMLRTPEVTNLRHWSKFYSSEPHLAGDMKHAQRICDLWKSYGIESKLVRYDVLQNIPISASLALHTEDGSVKYQASLTEPELAEDPTSSPSNGYPAFHGYSANGNVTGKLVYANFGQLKDFELLESKGVSVKDCIVICKYSKIFRGLKVRAAEKFGAAGVIIYSDPQEDGEYTEGNGYLPYPHGPARHPQSIQRGSVDFFSVAVGDPTTPGYPSLPGRDTKRKSPRHAIPGVPSLPISFSDALPFLSALEGKGMSPFEIGGENGDWKGGLDGVGYFTGPSALEVTLNNKGDYSYSPIYDVIGTVEGATEETIILGNHHDSWCCGAIDPVSGSAAMNEVARGLGKLQSMGWKPERKIIMASWDMEEYGLVGSTEWGEENADWLSKHCVAYINVDGSTNGGDVLGAVGSPLLSEILRSVAQNIPSPVSSKSTVYDDWANNYRLSNPDSTVPTVGTMGTGSDYTVMLDHLGIPCLDMSFSKQSKAVYLYHSNYDSFYWIEKFGDVGFKKHLAMARLFGVLAVRLAGGKVIPFNAAEYATVLMAHTRALASKSDICLSAIEDSVGKFYAAGKKLDSEARMIGSEEYDLTEGTGRLGSVFQINQRYMSIERALLRDEGLPGRTWFKHIIFAPGLWLGYQGVVFPGLIEALHDQDTKGAKVWIHRISRAIEKAAELIEA